MTADEIRRILLEEIRNVAPDADPETVGEDADLRDALDLDSMDVLNLTIALHQRLKIDIPERDYGSFRTLRSATEYLTVKVAA